MLSLTPALRKITTTIGAAAIALGAIAATATPVRADPNDVAKVIAGAAAIAIIGSAINNANRPQPGPPVSRHPVAPVHGWHHPGQRPGWAPPPHQRTCTLIIRGQRYLGRGAECIQGSQYRPQPPARPHAHDYRGRPHPHHYHHTRPGHGPRGYQPSR